MTASSFGASRSNDQSNCANVPASSTMNVVTTVPLSVRISEPSPLVITLSQTTDTCTFVEFSTESPTFSGSALCDQRNSQSLSLWHSLERVNHIDTLNSPSAA